MANNPFDTFLLVSIDGALVNVSSLGLMNVHNMLLVQVGLLLGWHHSDVLNYCLIFITAIHAQVHMPNLQADKFIAKLKGLQFGQIP